MKRFLLALCLLFLYPSIGVASPLNVDTIQDVHSLRQNLTWLADPNNEYSIEQVSSGKMQDQFAPLQNGFPITSHSPIWLHLVLTKGTAQASASAPLRLNIGDVPNGVATIFRQHTNANVIGDSAWWSEKLPANAEYILPMPSSKPLHLYIKVEDTPSLWFSPTITQQKSSQSSLIPTDSFLKGLLVLSIVGCLLRALTLQRQWPLWGALFVIANLVQVTLPLPLLSSPLNQWDIPVLIAPGLALMLLPHLGRHLLDTHKIDGLVDGSLTIYSLVGLALCLLPFAPQTIWIARLFSLWPLLILPIFPFALWGLATKRKHFFVFFVLCALPLAGAVVSLLALFGKILHPLAHTAPYWGLGLGSLALCLAQGQKKQADEVETPEVFGVMEDFVQKQSSSPAPKFKEERLSLGESQGKAALQLNGFDSLSVHETLSLKASAEKQADFASLGDDFFGKKTDPFFEQKELSLSAQEDLPSLKLKENIGKIQKPSGLICLTDDEVNPSYVEMGNQALELLYAEKNSPQRIIPFDLETLVHNACQTVQPLAESKNIPLSWHIAPNTPKIFLGEAVSVQQALFLLLQNAVRSVQAGEVELAIRSKCNEHNSCTIIFTISDTGGEQRSDAGIQHAWNLAARSGGGFSLEYAPNTGAVISFSAVFNVPEQSVLDDEQARALKSTGQVLLENLPAVENDGEKSIVVTPVVPIPVEAELTLSENLATNAEKTTVESVQSIGQEEAVRCRILVADMTTSNRHLLTNYLGGLPCDLVEAREAEHVGLVYGNQSVQLIIFDGAMPETDIATSIETVRQIEKMQNLPKVPILALATHENQGQRLLDCGCTHVLYKPFSKEALIEQVMVCLPGLMDNGLAPDEEYYRNDSNIVVPEEDEGAAYIRKLLGDHSTPQKLSYSPKPTWQVALEKPTIEQPAPAIVQDLAPLAQATPEAEQFTENKDADLDVPAVPPTPNVQSNKVSKKLVIIPSKHSAKDKKNLGSGTSGLVVTSRAKTQGQETQAHEKHIKIQESARLKPKPAGWDRWHLATSDFSSSQKLSNPDAGVELAETKPAEHEAPVPLLDLIEIESQENSQSAEQMEAEGRLAVAELSRDSEGVVESNDIAPESPDAALESAKGQNDSSNVLVRECHADLALAKAPEKDPSKPHFPSFALPGIEGEGIDAALLPLVPTLLTSLSELLNEIMVHHEEGESLFVQQAAAKISDKTETFGLIKLSRIASCVERAAEADDHEAVDTLLGDLTPMMTRYLNSLEKCYHNYMVTSR